MGLQDIIGKLMPLAGMMKPMVGFISNIVDQISPNQLTPEATSDLQKYVGTLYAAAKFFGPGLVVKTDNDLDDAALEEVIQICEQAAQKYGLQLNALEIV